MNAQQLDILSCLLKGTGSNQRDIAESSGYSVGFVNRTLRELQEEQLIDAGYRPTEKARAMAEANRPQRAVILAAGFGMRMIPVNQDRPKGLLEIQGEPIIEHTIRQLQDAGIKEIHVVIGYMKEQYEYLTDRFGADLIICRDYATRNNLYSLACAAEYLENAYIVPSDVYCYRNPFSPQELYSWYMVRSDSSEESEIRVTRTREILYIPEDRTGNPAIGIAYLTREDAAQARKKLDALTAGRKNSQAFWEAIISEKGRMVIPAKLVSPEAAVEINTYEQLRDLDYYNSQLQNEVISEIRKALHCEYSDILNVTSVKKGLTNRSFLFTVRGVQYIMRIPGEGTDYLDRKWEGRIYGMIRGKGFCEDNVWFNPETGYKISRYLENSRVCDDEDPEEIAAAMRLGRRFHDMKLQEGPPLDVYEAIQSFEDLWITKESRYRDYPEIRQALWEMKPYIGRYGHERCTTHGDLNPDNVLVTTGPDGEKQYHLIDWEYSVFNDPLMDVAAFITYNPHKEPKAYADSVIDAYYPEGCSRETRMLIYAYCALWAMYNSTFCEYKMQLGVEMEHFAMTVYRHAKDFSRIFRNEYTEWCKGAKEAAE